LQTIVNYIANALQARIPRIKIDTANDAATAHLTIPNKHGGKPINILAKAHAGIVVVFNKTPRLFDQDAKGIDKLAFDISEYLKGRSVYLDLLKSDGSDSGKDCIANSIEVQAENFTILTNLITRKGLLDSTELEKALQKENITHEYRSGHGDHEFFYWEQMMDPAFSFLAGIEEGTKDKLLIPEQGE